MLAMFMKWRRRVAGGLLASGLCFAQGSLAAPQILLPKTALQPNELAVVVNINDGLSRAIGNYYQRRRGIPEKNIIRIRFKAGTPALAPEEFARFWPSVVAQTPSNVQAYALTWAMPYRVGCMSVTSAFATGYDKQYCAAKTCDPTHPSPYFNSDSTAPYKDFKLRPTMALAARTLAEAKALIDRGVAADQTFPKGTGYLLSTNDAARNVRAASFAKTVDFFRDIVDLRMEKSDALRNVHDILFYFTGSVKVAGLETLSFVPGAIADHLTSAGGALDNTSQMPSTRWLEAGATGSYGTVVEPCNYLQKFPYPALVIEHYLRGETLIEAYWKSVAWPGEGLFIGEPLANPYGGYALDIRGHAAKLRTQALFPGRYRFEAASDPIGPYKTLSVLTVAHHGMQDINFTNLTFPYYRLSRLPSPP